MECEPIFLPEYQPCVHLNRPRLHTESYNYFPFIIFRLVVCHWIFQCKKKYTTKIKKNPLLFGLVWRAHPVFTNWLDDLLWRVTHKTRHANHGYQTAFQEQTTAWSNGKHPATRDKLHFKLSSVTSSVADWLELMYTAVNWFPTKQFDWIVKVYHHWCPCRTLGRNDTLWLYTRPGGPHAACWAFLIRPNLKKFGFWWDKLKHTLTIMCATATLVKL